MNWKIPLSLGILVLTVLALPLTVFADMGPKPMATIRVKNPPSGTYYLDLLIGGEGEYNALSEEERAALDPDMLAVLDNYEGADGRPALVRGTQVPLFGDLVGEADGEDMVHVFSYHGLPKEFRLIAVTEDLQVTVSQPIRRDALQIHALWDFPANSITRPWVGWAYIVQLLGTLLPTLLIEGAVLLLFRFPLKENWLVFLITNLVTQLGLTIFLGFESVQSGYLSYFFFFFPAELVILGAELCVGIPLLRDQRRYRGRSKGWRAAYVITANAASCGAGLLLAEPLFRLAMGLI